MSCSTIPEHKETVLVPTGSQSGIIESDGDTEHIGWDPDDTLIWDAPVGDRVLFAFPLPEGVSFDDYGLCTFDLKITGGPVDVMAFLERPGEKRSIYRPVDIYMPRPGWRTIHLDLDQPEIIRESHFAYDRQCIAFNLWSVNSGYPDMEPSRRIEIRNVRLVKRRLDVNWNGIDYTVTPNTGGDLVYEYPVTVRNLDGKAHSITARLDRLEGRYGSGTFTPSSIQLDAGDSTVCTATVRLPASRVGELPLLYCEWFLPVFSVDGIPGSEEGILRSSDRIELPLIIMPDMPEKDVPLVMFDKKDGLNDMLERYHSTSWGRKEGDGIVAQAERILSGDLGIPDGPGWARAYYYCHEHRCVLQYQGEDKHYCPAGGEYRDVDFMGVDLDRDYRAGEHNTVLSRTKTLALAFALTEDKRFSRAALDIMGKYREKYFTWDWLDLDASTQTIDRGRLHFAKYMETYGFKYMAEAIEILRATGGVSEQEANRIETELLIPAFVEITDYRMGTLCRQTGITVAALAGGLICRHAPLVAFAVKSPYGYFSLRRWGATADGISHGHGYSQTGYTGRTTEIAELLYRLGIDTFDHELKRLIDGSFWWSMPGEPGSIAAQLLTAARHYPDPLYRTYARRSLLDGEPPEIVGNKPELSSVSSVNFPNSGYSILRRPFDGETLEAEFRWGMPDNRGSFSVLSLGLDCYGYHCQSYPGHFHWGSTDLHHNWQIQTASHSTLVVDSHNQSGMKDYFKDHYMPHPSEQLYFKDGKDAAVTVAYNDRIYPGVKIWRTVCVLDGAFLVIDMLRSESEHTYDRWFHGVPDHSNGRDGFTIDLKQRAESLGTEDGYGMVSNLSSAITTDDFGSDWIVPANGGQKQFTLSARVLNETPVEVVHGFEWSRQFSTPEKEFMLLRRTKARNADFIVLFEPHRGKSKLTRFERFTVKDEKGNAVEIALGLNINLRGKSYEIVCNPEKKTVSVSGGVTNEVFSIDCR